MWCIPPGEGLGSKWGNLQQMQSRRRAHPCQTMARKPEDEDIHSGHFHLPPSDILLSHYWSNTTRRQQQEMLEESVCRDQHSNPLPAPVHSREEGRAKKGRNGSREPTDNIQHGCPQILAIIFPIYTIPRIPDIWSLAVYKYSRQSEIWL